MCAGQARGRRALSAPSLHPAPGHCPCIDGGAHLSLDGGPGLRLRGSTLGGAGPARQGQGGEQLAGGIAAGDTSCGSKAEEG